MTWQLSLTGLLIGALVGMTGMGGGSLMTPVLVLVFGFKPTTAIGTDILHGAIFKSFGAARQRKLGNVKARLTGWMLLGSAPMSLAGVALATCLERLYGDGIESRGSDPRGGACPRRARVPREDLLPGHRPSDTPFLLAPADKAVAFMIGFFGGFIVGLTSVGSGPFFALDMLLVFPLTAAKVVGTDIFHAAALLWVAGLRTGRRQRRSRRDRLAAGRVDPGGADREPVHRKGTRALAADGARGDARGRGPEAPRGAGRERHHPSPRSSPQP